MKWFVFTCALLLILTAAPVAFAIEDSMKILSVSEMPDGNMTGGVATLTLEIVPGKGRVFIDTYPLTKVDTQISTRIAKQIACDFLDIDCSQSDFIYTIKSGSSIIGGPSAGAAMTLMTIALLDNQPIIKGVSMSGTINSGGLIGSVGGLKEKIEAAARFGINTVLIPKGEREYIDPLKRQLIINQTNETAALQNITVDLIELGKTKGVNVVEVANIYDALPYFVEKTYDSYVGNISLPEFYTETMSMLASDLCSRSTELLDTLNVENFQNKQSVFYITKDGVEAIGDDLVLDGSNIDVNSTYNDAIRLLNVSKVAREYGQFYAAASYCYGASLNLQFLHKFSKNVTEIRQEVDAAFNEYELDLRNYETLTDLQTYMLVEERISEARENFKSADEQRLEGNTYSAINLYVIALERIASAKAWANFARGFGEPYAFLPTDLVDSCDLRIREAEERLNYLTLYAPSLTRFNEGIQEARRHKQLGEFELCLHKASIAKADIDVILASSGVQEKDIEQHVADKMQVAQELILRQIDKGNFPVIGYSYLEYAKSLATQDPRSSILYLQYAIELSNLDTYFPDKKSVTYTVEKKKEWWFLIGFVSCFILIIIVHLSFKVLHNVSRKKHKRHSKKKSKS